MVNKNRLIKTFCELAKIKSPSGKEIVIARKIESILKNCGLSVKRDSYGNIVAKFAGKGKPLIFCAHMDTVSVGAGKKINLIVGKKKISSDGTTILGADNKDSIAAILEAVRVLNEQKLAHRPLELVFTREEEAISRGAKNLDFSLLKGKECIISDFSHPYGAIVQSAPGLYQFEARIKGKRCHVKEPEKGVNAILVAADAIKKMPLGRIDEFTTANVAYQIGGLRGLTDAPRTSIEEITTGNRNTVPDISIILGEVRGAKKENIKRALVKIQKIFSNSAKKFNAKIKFNERKLSDGYFFQKNDPLLLMAKNVFKKQNVKCELRHTLGGTDANIFNGRGIRSIVISSASRNNHQNSEYLIIRDLEKLAEFYIIAATI
ncbi:MAG: M20/M25/M40 family metallo-hydrolase [Parcubacteria group bacterium]